MHRWDGGGKGDDVVVIFNFSNTALTHYRVGFPQAGLWQLRLNTDAAVYDADFGELPTTDTSAVGHAYDGMHYSGEVTLPPYSALIFSQ